MCFFLSFFLFFGEMREKFMIQKKKAKLCQSETNKKFLKQKAHGVKQIFKKSGKGENERKF